MKELEIVKQVIKNAGQEILKYYNTGFEVSYKGKNDPFTQADLISEKIILERLKEFDYGILSEEINEENDRFNKERAWIIDPLDGTQDFIEKTNDFTVMIALVEKGGVILGAVYQPIKDKLYYAVLGRGAFVDKNKQVAKQLRVTSQNKFSEANMVTSRMHQGKFETKFAEKTKVKNFIPRGSAGLKICLVAEGKADLYLSSSTKTKEWDICAADIILKEAGGRLTTMKGCDISYNKKNPRNLDGVVVSNGVLHEQVIKKIKTI